MKPTNLKCDNAQFALIDKGYHLTHSSYDSAGRCNHIYMLSEYISLDTAYAWSNHLGNIVTGMNKDSALRKFKSDDTSPKHEDNLDEIVTKLDDLEDRAKVLATKILENLALYIDNMIGRLS